MQQQIHIFTNPPFRKGEPIQVDNEIEMIKSFVKENTVLPEQLNTVLLETALNTLYLHFVRVLTVAFLTFPRRVNIRHSVRSAARPSQTHLDVN